MKKKIFYGLGASFIFAIGVVSGIKLSYVGVVKRQDLFNFHSDDILFGSFANADNAISELFDIFDVNRTVTVADLCDIAGVESEYVYSKYGWKDLPEIKIKRKRDGYYLDLPRAIVL